MNDETPAIVLDPDAGAPESNTCTSSYIPASTCTTSIYSYPIMTAESSGLNVPTIVLSSAPDPHSSPSSSASVWTGDPKQNKQKMQSDLCYPQYLVGADLGLKTVDNRGVG